MIYKKFFVCLIFISICFGKAQIYSLDADAYRSKFAAHYFEALRYVNKIKPLLYNKLQDQFLTDIGIAVIFPELTRYSFIRNIAETKVLEFSYVVGGHVDFSVGMMQMKPSFAGQLELDADEYCKINYPELFKSGDDEQANRGLRISRLKNLNHQVEYLSVFLHIMGDKYPKLAADPLKMVSIFSAAYNSGYDKTFEELEQNALKYYFPYGKNRKGEQYSYTEIAVDYYKKIARH
ncbi:MAG: hypothetical protein Ta2A_19880 [Treponemataceae bacterium]|nr:MAG: hypothetical protein Ta2A_19880 [Treponemataceae bacterium]